MNLLHFFLTQQTVYQIQTRLLAFSGATTHQKTNTAWLVSETPSIHFVAFGIDLLDPRFEFAVLQVDCTRQSSALFGLSSNGTNTMPSPGMPSRSRVV